MELIMCWKKGNSKTYTKRLDLAEIAIKNGFVVSIVKKDTKVY
jgi:hypothetical protein